ncbi:MAG: response regulator [Mycobacteriales bacterium]
MDGRRSAKILMVDDRPENLLALEAILQGLGHELLKATSGEEALKILLAEDVAVILLDVQMPGMDGFETAAHVKKREKTRDIPILFLTAIDGEAHQAFRGYAAGAVDYLSKPFDPWVLKAKVGVFVELYERRSELAGQAEQLRRQLARYDSAGLGELSRQVCDAVDRARAAAAPDSALLLEEAATAARALQAALQPAAAAATQPAAPSTSVPVPR